ncbi:MAG: hypothetical protein ACKVT0_03690, partial [Planctomycetaceae bacterium]
ANPERVRHVFLKNEDFRFAVLELQTAVVSRLATVSSIAYHADVKAGSTAGLRWFAFDRYDYII